MSEPTLPPPRVAYVVSSGWALLNFYAERIKAMQQQGWEVLGFCPDDCPKLDSLGIEHIRIPLDRTLHPSAVATTLLLLTSGFIEHQPVLVHSHTTGVHLLSALAARTAGVPVVLCTVHGHYHTGMEMLPSGRIQTLEPFVEAYYRLVASQVDAYLVINKTEHKTLEQNTWMPASKLHLIQEGVGVDLMHFKSESAPPKKEARRRLGLDKDLQWVGFFGRLLPHKAGDLFTVWNTLSTRVPNAGLLVSLLKQDDPTLEEELLRLQRQQPHRIVVLRNRAPSEMPLLYKAIDVLLLPSMREGASTVLMEAAAMQVPAVAYDIAGTRDIIAHERTGLLVSPGAHQEFVDAAETLLQSGARRRDFGAAGRARAEMRFSRQKAQHQVFTLYEDLLAARFGEE